jgi:hypothetical protein
MNPIEPRTQAALDAALGLIATTVAGEADRVSETMGTAALSSARVSERDMLLGAQFDLRRNIGTFQRVFREMFRDKVMADLAPTGAGRRPLATTDWHSLSLVDDREVEDRMSFDRIGRLIAHECEWELRELAAYMGALLRTGRADEDRNPLRPELLATALVRGIEAVSQDREVRKVISRELGGALAKAMPPCYKRVIQDLQGRGVQPVGLMVRGVEGPGNQLPGHTSGYSGLPEDRSAPSSRSGLQDSGRGGESALGGAAATARSRFGAVASSYPSTGGGIPASSRGGQRADTVAAHSDAQLMNLLRRLTALASRPGALDALHPQAAPERGTYPGAAPRGAAGPSASTRGEPLASGQDYREGLDGLMAVNLIRAHRDELRQVSTGKLDHMVIDVVGSLFDQILSDSRVPPQMARQIARLQLPVLRVALNDATFFSSRRHPVRRFVNRIASLACAFDDFEDGAGKEFLVRVRELVDEIVEGDFDQIELYAAKLGALEAFIGQQTHRQAESNGAAATLEGKESDLRIQQRFMLQLQQSLAPLALPPYLREFISQVWTQALVLAVRRDGKDSERAQRFRRAARELVMSVQPKGSPMLRKKFLLQLPPLMKDLNEGIALIAWPEPAQKEFFAKLLPAHAESLKGQSLSELDYNMMSKQLETIFNTPVPGIEALSPADPVADVGGAAIEQRFTPEEAQRVGLVQESAVDWSGTVDIDLGADEAAASPGDAGESTGAAPVDIGLDINLEPGSGEPAEPTRGAQLFDHVKLGFAYQMHLKDQWQKVRLTYVSPGRSFFVFTLGKKHQETISMTARMLSRMCETGRMRAVESAYLLERATHRARKQLAALGTPTRH